MREKFLIAILIIAAAVAELFSGVSAQEAAAKAKQLINQARAALGGDKLKSLSVTGNYRRAFGQMEMAGEVNFDLLLPDKMMKTEIMNPMPSIEITRIEALNGDNGKKPRFMTQTATAGAPRNPEEMEKRMKEIEAEAAKQPDVEYRIYLGDYREVNGVSFPHKLTRSIENEVNEELEIKNVKINPQLEPEKFVKK